MRRLLLLLLAVIAAGLVIASRASAGCLSAVVVDGQVLHGIAVDRPGLPPRAGSLRAISPACNDGGPIEEDRRTTVVRVRGLPQRVAVLPSGRSDSVFVSPGTITFIGTHPLHRVLHGRTPAYRHCRPYRTDVRGRVEADGVLRIRTAERTVILEVDAATRFTNRPVYEPVLQGQRLRVMTSRCGPRRVADRVTFLGATPRREPYRRGIPASAGGGFEVAGWQVVLVLLFASAAGLLAVIWRYVGR